MSDVHSPPAATEPFTRFLDAADHAALEMLLDEGISPFTGTDRNTYYTAIEDLAKAHSEPYTPVTGLDEVVSTEELSAKIDAAHMVGVALGLRLAGQHGLGGVR